MEIIKSNDILIKNGRVIDPANGLDRKCDIYAVNGVIAEVGDIARSADYVINAEDLVITPGFIDMHAHLREPGQEYKEDYYSGSMSALAGGYTTVATMANTNPAVDNAALVRSMIKRAAEVDLINILVIGAVTKGLKGAELAELYEMSEAGAIAFSDDGHYIDRADVMINALKYVKPLNKIIICHEELSELVKGGVMNEGKKSAEYGVRVRPAIAEELGVMRDCMLAEYTGGRVHIAHISTARSLEIIREYKRRKVQVSCEVTPHHMTLTENEVELTDSSTKVNPPLRTLADCAALRKGLRDDVIDIIVTDHAPHADFEKDCEYDKAKSGFIGLETSFAVLLNAGIELEKIIRKMTCEPARLFKINAGNLSVGSRADIAIIDLKREWEVGKFYSKSQVSPYAGKKYNGKVISTISRGNIYKP